MLLVRLTATGTVNTGACRPKMVVLTPVAAITTLVLRDNGAGGTVMLEVQAAANGSSVVVPIPDGVGFGTDCHGTLTGAGGVAYVGF